MKTHIILLRIAGGISLLFMFFHLAFYKAFHWQHTLNCLSKDNHAIMLTYHYIIILIIGFMGVLPMFQAKALLNSSLKYTVLSTFACFYLIRIVTEFTLFGFTMPQSPIIIVMCAIPMIFYMFPLVRQI